jgi:hypothetical protein
LGYGVGDRFNRPITPQKFSIGEKGDMNHV